MTLNKNKIVQLNFINIKSLLPPGNETQNRKKITLALLQPPGQPPQKRTN